MTDETGVPEGFFDDVADESDVAEQPAAVEQAEQVEEVEQKIEEVEDPKQEDAKEKTVPYGALHEERMKRKEMQRELDEHRAKVSKMEDAFNRVLEMQKKAQEDPVPEDPFDRIEYNQRQLEKQNQELANWRQQQEQTAKQQQEWQQFTNAYQTQAREFAQTTPDFNDAYQFVTKGRAQELMAVGYSGQEIDHILIQDEAAFVSRAFQDGVNPAERVYALAKARGYKPPQKAQPTDTAKMDALEKGSNAAKTLTGGKTGNKMSLEQLAELDGDAFEKGWRELYG